MATLWKRKRKSGIYYVDFMYHGKRYRKSTRTSDRKLAELFKKDIEVKIAKENFGFGELKKKKIRLSEFSEKYFRFSKATKAMNTYLLDERIFRSLYGFLGDIQMCRITPEDIEKYKVDRLNKVKPSSVNLEIRHLKSAFESSVKWGIIQENPLKEVKQLKIRNSNLPKYLTGEEVKELLSLIPNGRFKNLICFYLYTGCRRNEALKLTWNEVDLVESKATFTETKSGKSRIVPFNGHLRQILNKIDEKGDRPFPFRSDFVTHKFKKYLRKTEIKNKENLNVHSLRHTFASHLVMEGVDLYTVSKLLGHSSVKVTEMYAHLAPDHLKAAVKRLPF